MTDISPSTPTDSEARAALRTFLIVDIRGYTRFTVEHGDEAAARLAGRFAELTDEVVRAYDGEVIELRGDEALAVFDSARQSLRAAVELQDRFAAETSGPFRAGIGLDAGEAIAVKGGFRGAALNLAARLCSLAGPGEVLASDTVVNLARKLDGIEYVERGFAQLKGFADPVKVMEVLPSPTHPQPLTPATRSSLRDVPQAGEGGIGLPSPLEGEGSGVRGSRALGGEGVQLPIGGFLGALPSGILVARDEELQRILNAVDAVAGGKGRLVLLAGEPGAGKTRLAQEATLHIRNRELVVAAGSCFEPRESVPYYPFLDVLAALYGAAPATIRAEVPQRWPYLSRLLPEAPIPLASSSSDGHEDQERLLRAVTGFIQAIADQMPAALLLDDLHWADASSLELLEHVSRHTRAHRVLILGTYRDVEVGRQHPLERVLLDLNRQQLVERIPVRRLNGEGTAALIGVTMGEAEVSAEFADLLQQRTDGNPFFVQEVLRALVERGDVYREAGRWERRDIEEIEVPESVRAVIGQRLSRLDEDTQELLREASVLGQTFTFDELQGLGEYREEQVEQALEEAVRAGLIRETVRDHYAFNHALTQQALYGELSSRRKRRLHLAAGEALERIPERKREGRQAELAWHFVEGDDPERAARYSILAGEAAEAIFALREAKRHYQTALEMARETEDTRREAEASFKLGRALLRLDAYEEGMPILRRAARLAQELADPLLEAQAEAIIAMMAGSQGRIEDVLGSIERMDRLLDTIDRLPPSEERFKFYDDLQACYFVTSRYQEVLDTAERRIDVARALGDERWLLRAEIGRHGALMMLGRSGEHAHAWDDLVARAETVNDLETLYTALANAAELSMLAGEFERSRSYREREVVQAERLGTGFVTGTSIANLAQILIYLGDWPEGRRRAEQALELFRSIGSGWGSVFAIGQLGLLDLREGDWDAAARELEEAAGIAQSMGDLQWLRYGNQALAELDLLQGRPEEAIARLEPLLDRPGLKEHDVTYLLPTLAWAHLELGDVERAQEVVTDAIERLEAEGNRREMPDALRIKGMVLARQGRWDEAEKAFEEAASLAKALPHPYAEARALYEWGLMLKSSGRVDPGGAMSEQRLQNALEIFRRLGAKRDVERTEQALQ